MFEAVVEEPLVILVKLADRLHNMRTVYALSPDKQRAVAEETQAVWCSMAASLGWHRLKVSVMLMLLILRQLIERYLALLQDNRKLCPAITGDQSGTMHVSGFCYSTAAHHVVVCHLPAERDGGPLLCSS